mmetsp:Transcript_14666/g.62928  ORF Transcript_14666/g.62928 Transcript_14666/m.62928 type:complete len:536 (-) Transcript_14666:565-2172(-)
MSRITSGISFSAFATAAATNAAASSALTLLISFVRCSAYRPTVCCESFAADPGACLRKPRMALERERMPSFSAPSPPKTDMSSACMTSSRSCRTFSDVSGPAAPGDPTRETLSLTLTPHPLSREKDSTKTCPSVMLMNSSTKGLGCVKSFSGAAESAASFSARLALAASASRFLSSMTASIFFRVASGMSSKPAGSAGTTTVASPSSSAASPTVPEFFSLARLPRYAPASWYITPRSVSDPPPSLSFRRATRCRVMPRNRLRSASSALMIMPSYSTICSALGASSESSSAISSCGLSLAMSRENPTKPVKSSSTNKTSFPSPRAPSATANAAHVAAYRSAKDASGAQETTVKSTAPCSFSWANAFAPESNAAAPTAPYTQRTEAFLPDCLPSWPNTFACATTAFKPSSERFVPTSPVSSMHCPLPTGVKMSIGFTPVTSGVVMGFRSSTLGGSRKSSDPEPVADAASRNFPSASPGTEPPSSGSPSGPILLFTTSDSGGMWKRALRRTTTASPGFVIDSSDARRGAPGVAPSPPT